SQGRQGDRDLCGREGQAARHTRALAFAAAPVPWSVCTCRPAKSDALKVVLLRPPAAPDVSAIALREDPPCPHIKRFSPTAPSRLLRQRCRQSSRWEPRIS